MMNNKHTLTMGITALVVAAALLSACGNTLTTSLPISLTPTFAPPTSIVSATPTLASTLAPKSDHSINPLTPKASTTPIPTPVPTSTLAADWHVYKNDVYGYRFSYPPSAKIVAEGVVGYPTEELPSNMTPAEYLAQLQKSFPAGLCVGVRYEMGFLVIRAPLDKGGKYAGACGAAGIGAYDLITKTETILIGGRQYLVSGYEIHERDAKATFLSELFSTELEDGTRISYGGDWAESRATYQDYLPVKATLLQILASYQKLK